MGAASTLTELMEYTEWERLRWHQWFENQSGSVLAISPGPHADGRFQTVGELIRHIFSAEKRYVERLRELPLSDFTDAPSHECRAIFGLGQLSRLDLRDYIASVSDEEWNTVREFPLLNYRVTATPHKIVMHILLHEVRHWAQIATIFRQNGLTVETHDFLFSPVLGESIHNAAAG